MTNENETFNEVFAEALNCKAVRDYRMGILPNGMQTNSVRGAEDVVADYAVRLRDAHKREVAELRECLKEAVNNECNYCRTIRKDGTYGKCEHLKEDGKCDYLRGVKCIVHKWRKALEGKK